MNIPDGAVDAAELAAHDAAAMWKWSEMSRDESRAFFSEVLEAAAPHLIAQIAEDILEGMQAWAGDKELGFLEGYSDASDDAVTRSAGAGE